MRWVRSQRQQRGEMSGKGKPSKRSKQKFILIELISIELGTFVKVERWEERD